MIRPKTISHGGPREQPRSQGYHLPTLPSRSVGWVGENPENEVAEKINVNFHKNSENRAKILKFSCVRCHFVKFDIYFLGLS